MKLFLKNILLIFVSVNSCHLVQASVPAALPLGIVIRPSLFSKVVRELSDMDQQGKPMQFSFCYGGVKSELTIEGQWADPTWSLVNIETVYLSAAAKNVKLSVKAFESCEEDAKLTLNGYITLTDGQIAGFWNAKEMTVQIQINAQDKSITPHLVNHSGINQLLQSNGTKDAIIQSIVDTASQQLTLWVREKLRGLIFTENAMSLMGDEPLLKSGVLLKKGAITLELDNPQPSQEHITFSFYPRKSASTFASESALEFYFNASFFDVDHIKSLSGLDPMNTQPQLLMNRLQQALVGPESISDAPITRPNLSSSQGDLTLVLPEILINQALSTFYREGLLRFKTTVGIGEQTKGIIAKEAYDVATVLTINPNSAPSVSFLPDQFKLDVKDYVTDIGTWIEDRIIPSSQIASSVRISAQLKIDSGRKTVNLALKPQDFLLELKDLKGRLNEKEIDFFRTVANGVWKDFLTKNSELILFPLVFNSEGLGLEIVQATVDGQAILLDISLGFEK